METNPRRKLIALVIAGLAAVGAGGAYAATRSSSGVQPFSSSQAPADAAATRNPAMPGEAFLGDLARRLHVSQQQLTAALKGAFIDQLNAAVKAGRLTQAQANAIEQRLAQGGLPPFRFGPPPAPRLRALGGALAAAASYLGMSDLQLMQQLRSGKTLAQIAKSRGKSVSGLEQAITSAIKSRLDQAVAAGRITSGQEQQLLSRLKQRLDRHVNRSGPAFGRGPQGGPPSSSPQGSSQSPTGPPGSPPGAPASGWPPY